MVTGSLANGSNIVPAGTTLADLIWVQARPVVTAAPSQQYTVAGSAPGVTYTVTVTGAVRRCTCPNYSYRRTCKHLTRV